jgi:hypothetical protein
LPRAQDQRAKTTRFARVQEGAAGRFLQLNKGI